LDYYLDVKVNTHTCFSMDEPSKLYAKWEKPDTSGHILLNSTHELSRISKPI
jgi:hypothetical protein